MRLSFGFGFEFWQWRELTFTLGAQPGERAQGRRSLGLLCFAPSLGFCLMFGVAVAMAWNSGPAACATRTTAARGKRASKELYAKNLRRLRAEGPAALEAAAAAERAGAPPPPP